MSGQWAPLGESVPGRDIESPWGMEPSQPPLQCTHLEKSHWAVSQDLYSFLTLAILQQMFTTLVKNKWTNFLYSPRKTHISEKGICQTIYSSNLWKLRAWGERSWGPTPGISGLLRGHSPLPQASYEIRSCLTPSHTWAWTLVAL